MGKVIAIANQKGGVGKTTTTLNMGMGLYEKNKKVLMVDFDHQANLTLSCGVNNFDDLKDTIAEVIKETIDEGKYKDLNIRTFKSDDGRCLDFIPSNVNLAKVNLEMIQVMAREFILTEILAPLKERYDYILIDCAPSLSVDLINALTAADEVIIVTTPGKFSTSGTEQLVKSIYKVKSNLNKKIEIAGILLNRVDRRNNFTKDIINIMQNVWGKDIKIFDTEIPNSIRIEESQSMGESIIEYEPDNKVAIAFSDFIDEYQKVRNEVTGYGKAI